MHYHQLHVVDRVEWLEIMNAMYNRASPEAVWKVSGPVWEWRLNAWMCCLQTYDATAWWSIPFLVRAPVPAHGAILL